MFFEAFEQLEVHSFQTVQVDVVQHEAAAILGFNHKGRAADGRRHIKAFSQSLHERRFAGSERALEQEAVTWLSGTPERFAKRAHAIRRRHVEVDGPHPHALVGRTWPGSRWRLAALASGDSP